MGRKKVKAQRKRTDREKLELFLKRAEELGEYDLVRNGFGYRHTINWSRADGGRSTLEEPPRHEVKAILGAVRKLVADDSDIWLNRVHGIVYQHLRQTDNTAAYRADLVTMNQKWRESFSKGLGQLTINEIVVTPEHAWDVWVNGEALHDDLNYVEELDRLGPFEDSHRARFLDAVISTLIYTNWLARNIYFFLNTNLLDLPAE